MDLIRALLVDDERLAIIKLESMLSEVETVQVVGTFTDPAQAIEAAPLLNPDIIFLDIEMPELNGMQAAEQLQSICPKTMIVFLTAYNTYAVEAFELGALDYLLKPVNRSRLHTTLQRLEERLKGQPPDPSAGNTVIHCFRSIRFERNGSTLPHFRWRTTKALELFAYLLYNRNRVINKDVLIELLWPDIPSKKASTLLYTTIYQVRQCLKQGQIDLLISNVSAGEGYRLETDGLQLDVDEWEQGIQRLPAINLVNYLEHQLVFDLYIGDYLGDYDFIWAESERQRLRTLWVQHAMNLAGFYSTCNKHTEAITVYRRIILMQPYYEQAHLNLMIVYDRIGERTAVEEQYTLLARILQQELGIAPIADITRWYEDWKQDNYRNI